MKGTVPKRLDICYGFGTFSYILNFYFLIVVTSATQHKKFLTSFMWEWCYLQIELLRNIKISMIQNLLGSRDSFIPHSRVTASEIEISRLLNGNKKSNIFFAIGLNLLIYFGHWYF